MSQTKSGMLGSAATGVLIALLLTLALIPLGLGSANAAEVVRLSGADTVDAAIAFSEFAFPDGADEAFVGREDLFPDSLASGGGQGLLDAPLLLTDSQTLSPEVADELERLDVATVNILGGEQAVSAAVEDELAADYTVERYSGPTRIETAIDLATRLFPTARTAILARAYAGGTDATQAFADSLAAGGWAADDGYPVLLTQTEVLTETTADYVESSQVDTVFVVGGTQAVSQAVVDALEAQGKTVERISGPTRFDTAVEIAAERGFDGAGDADTTILVEGQIADAYAPGFAAAATADLADAPIVLANGEDLPRPTAEFFNDAAGPAPRGATASPTGTGAPGEDRFGDIICAPMVTAAACDEAEERFDASLVGPTGSPTGPTGSPTGPAGEVVAGPFGFEADAEGWTVSTASPGLPPSGWARDAGGHESETSFQVIPYGELIDTALESPALAVAGGEVVLEWWNTYDIEGGGFDEVAVEWSSDGGDTWTELDILGGQNVGYPEFAREEVAFDAPAGEIHVRFLFYSDEICSSTGTPLCERPDGYEGVRIDDVALRQ